MSIDERAVLDEISVPFLIAAQRLVDAIEVVASRLEMDFSALKNELDSSESDGDKRRGGLALTAADRRMGVLDNLIAIEMSPLLEGAIKVRTQLAALDEGVQSANS